MVHDELLQVNSMTGFRVGCRRNQAIQETNYLSLTIFFISADIPVYLLLFATIIE